jgi:hypothetical protein
VEALCDSCIHTFRHSEDLRRQATNGGRHTLTEHKAWVTGRQLWADATRIGQQMALLFSAADRGKGVIYWAVIDSITVDDQTRETTCGYSHLQMVEPKVPLSTLRLWNGGRPVSDDLIRPYAICQTPAFLR